MNVRLNKKSPGFFSVSPVFQVLCAALAMALGACGPAAPVYVQPLPGASLLPPAGKSFFVSFQSQEVRKGIVEESGQLSLFVILPPSYEQKLEQRYPVIYCLNGYGSGPGSLASTLKLDLELAWAKGICPESILVGIPMNNALGCSFYADSPVTGNWMGMLSNEAVALVDASYRTVAKPGARMLAGYSVGGFGSWNTGLAHPDVFSHVWSCCPAALSPDTASATILAWDSAFANAYGAVFAPDGSKSKPYARRPDGWGTPADKAVLERWYQGFGDPQSKITRYLSQQDRLVSMRFDYGLNDSHEWIPPGVRYVTRVMKDAGLPVQVQGWDAGHDVTPEMIQDGLLPQIQEAFKAWK